MPAILKPPLLLCAALIAGCAAPHPDSPRLDPLAAAAVPTEHLDLVAALAQGSVKFDLFLPASRAPAPLVVVAHGFMRSKANMADWGRCLATEGFAAAVLTMPTAVDHAGNGKAIDELIAWLLASPEFGPRLDGRRLGTMGHSAGGLATLLAAVGNPAIGIWVGLDPVDLGGMGAAAVSGLRAKAVVIRAEPSVWNSFGNARGLVKALGPACEDHLVPQANHIDPEWPTDLPAQLAVGMADEGRRRQFVGLAVEALQGALFHEGSRDSRRGSAGTGGEGR
jgi:hypothetical protein